MGIFWVLHTPWRAKQLPPTLSALSHFNTFSKMVMSVNACTLCTHDMDKHGLVAYTNPCTWNDIEPPFRDHPHNTLCHWGWDGHPHGRAAVIKMKRITCEASLPFLKVWSVGVGKPHQPSELLHLCCVVNGKIADDALNPPPIKHWRQ